MKKTSLLLMCIVLATNIFAENTKTTLKSATVFFKGAELTHVATVNLSAGENIVSLEGLTPSIDVNSLKINVNNNVVIASSEFSTDYLTQKTSTTLVTKLRDSIAMCNAEIAKLTTAISVNNTTKTLLDKGIENNLRAVEKGLSLVEITQNLDYYGTKANALANAIDADNKKLDKWKRTLQNLSNQLNQEQSKNGVNNGVLKLTLVAPPLATTATVTVSYYTTAASWTPYYDMNIQSVDKPVILQSRSKVRQTTGLDWEKVKITLSTATPSRGKDAPLFSTWFLNYVTYQPQVRAKENAAMQNSISYALQGRVAGVEVQNVSGAPGAASKIRVRGDSSIYGNSKPIWVIDGMVLDDIDISADDLASGDAETLISSAIAGLTPNDIESFNILKDGSATSLYGARAMSGVIVITTKSKKIEDYVLAEEKNISMEYKIDLPYTIPGNGKEQIIDLKKNELSAKYKYYCAPKLDENVYLVADISDWEKLNLLSGQANITYDGTFVGQTFLNTNSWQKDLSITLNTDKRISVKREKQTDFSSVKVLGSDVKVTLAYRLTVKNNQNKPIHIVLKEQYPISSQKDIVVELLEKTTTTPTVNKEDVGVITWEADLAVGESKTYQISYSVKYPKDKKINL